MLDKFIHSFSLYYGLDWVTLVLGLWGAYLVTRKNKYGFLLSTGSCICGFLVAVISGQYGFIAHNFILGAITLRGFFIWEAEEKLKK